MQRDQMMNELLDWADRADKYSATSAEIHLHLAKALEQLNAQPPPQVGDKVTMRLHLGLIEPPTCYITGIVQPWPELGLAQTGYVVLVEPGRSQICTAGDFLVLR